MNELEVAKRVARQAGGLLMNGRGSRLEVVIKADSSPVTQMDRLSSALIRGELFGEFPDYGIIDEECPAQSMPDARYKWVVDPLESTISYIKGSENFGVMIGLLYDSSPILGVTYRPMIDELVFGVAGGGAFAETRGGLRRVNVNCSPEMDILVSMFRDDAEIKRVADALGSARLIPMPSSFKTIEVAKGNASAFFCPEAVTMDVWDLCAPQIILEEAGGRMTDIYGKSIDYSSGLVNRRGVIASNRQVHQALLDAVAGHVYPLPAKSLYS
jgi:fructose-1,6-bisphosphatase/inositol monophosphatase family enzyme